MKKYTIAFIVVALTLVIGFDVWVILKSGSENSISQVIIDYSYQYPFITFLVGFVCGHLFWQMPKKKDALADAVTKDLK